MIKKIWNLFFSRTFFVYLLIGGLATIVDWGIFALGVYGLSIHYTISVVLSFSAGSLTNFSLNKYLNFNNQYKKLHYQFALYLVIALIGLALTIGIMWAGIELFGINQMIARVIATAIVLIYNFLGHKFVTFGLLK